jgi:hypothetical protein
MTFQLAMIATDGIVLGSDRLVSKRNPGRSNSFQSIEGPKIVQSENGMVICAGAGGPQSASIADAIAAKADPAVSTLNWRTSLKAIAESIAGNSVADEILVVRREPLDLILVNREGLIASTAVIESKVCTGVLTTSHFFTEHLWRKSTMVSMKKLAQITLAYAAKERPAEVGMGFDILFIAKEAIESFHYPAQDTEVAGLMSEFQSHTASLLF